MRSVLQLCLICATISCRSYSLKLPSFLEKRLPNIAAACIHVCLQTSFPMQASAGIILLTPHALTVSWTFLLDMHIISCSEYRLENRSEQENYSLSPSLAGDLALELFEFTILINRFNSLYYSFFYDHSSSSYISLPLDRFYYEEFSSHISIFLFLLLEFFYSFFSKSNNHYLFV